MKLLLQDLKILKNLAKNRCKIILLQDVIKILPARKYLEIFLARFLQDFYTLQEKLHF